MFLAECWTLETAPPRKKMNNIERSMYAPALASAGFCIPYIEKAVTADWHDVIAFVVRRCRLTSA